MKETTFTCWRMGSVRSYASGSLIHNRANLRKVWASRACRCQDRMLLRYRRRPPVQQSRSVVFRSFTRSFEVGLEACTLSGASLYFFTLIMFRI